VTAEPYRPMTDPGASPAADPDVIVVPGDVVEGDPVDSDVDSDAGAAEGAADYDDARGSEDYQANTEPDLVAASAEAGAGTIDGDSSSAAAMTADPVTTDEPAADLGQQWHDIQAMFVDDPRGSVGRAAAAADAAVNALAETLRRQQASLVQPDGDPAGTEELREALRGYRIFCHAVADIGRQLPQPQP